MKGGGIRFASNGAEADREIDSLWEHEIRGFRPAAVLIEPRLPVTEEYYLGITYDQGSKLPVLVFSRQGGINVEEAAGKGGTVARRTVSVLRPYSDYLAKELLTEGRVGSQDLAALVPIVGKLVRAFLEHDLLLCEINPLARLEDGSFIALDTHCEMDDDAISRQPRVLESLGIKDFNRSAKQATSFEAEAREIDARDHRGVAGRMVEFDGPLGLLIGGGGASLAAFDAVRRYGGRPANYCEIGGNPSVSKVADLTRLILSKPGVRRIAVIMNVVNNTRVDLVARGVIKGILQAGRNPAETIAVFRIPGAWEDEGFKLLRHYGVEPCDRRVSIDQAARRAVESLQARTSGPALAGRPETRPGSGRGTAGHSGYPGAPAPVGQEVG